MVDLPKIDAEELFAYETFTGRKQTLSDILNYNHKGFKLSLKGEWLKYFSMCINAHHRSHGSTVFRAVSVIKNPSGYNHNNFMCSFYRDGEFYKDIVGIGATLSAKPKRDPLEVHRKKVLQFMRFVIQPDMSFIRNSLLTYRSSCAHCGVSLDENNTHLDHCGDLEFRHLASVFIDVVGLHNMPLVPVFGRCDQLPDNITEAWIEYHHNNAQVQLLCMKCNLQKSKGVI